MKNKHWNIKELFFCLLCSCLCVVFGFGFIVGWFSKQSSPCRPHSKTFDECHPDISPERIRENLRWYASSPSLAGTNYSLSKAKVIMNRWSKAGLTDIKDHKYNVLLSYPPKPPLFNKVTVHGSNGSAPFEFTARPPKNLQVPSHDAYMWTPYHAFTPSRTVKGKLVFARHGYELEYTQQTLNFSFEGKILLIVSSYGPGIQMIKRAERVGAVGMIVFDPDSMADDVIRRGSIPSQFGDALTQGYPSLDYVPKLNVSEASLPSIPVLTVDKVTGLRLSEEFAQIPERLKDSKYVVTLQVENSLERKYIHNVCGKIKGKTDRIVLVGGHRDAWVKGGMDPGASTAILMELVTTFTKMRQRGWKPLRTLMFCSWDAEEFGMHGSIEFVEHHRELLNRMAVAYVNIDSPVMGTKFLKVVGSPILTELVRKAASEVAHPIEDQTLLQSMNGTVYNQRRKDFIIVKPDANTDHAPFQFNLGVPSVSILWMNDSRSLYPAYHTARDTFEYVENHIDPDFKFHRAFAELHARMLFSLLSDEVLPFNVTAYAVEIEYVQGIGNVGQVFPALNNSEILHTIESFLSKVKDLRIAANKFHEYLSAIDTANLYEVQNANDRLMGFERAFIDPLFEGESLMNRHVILGPSFCRLLQLFPGIDRVMCMNMRDDELSPDVLHGILMAIARVSWALERATQLLL